MLFSELGQAFGIDSGQQAVYVRVNPIEKFDETNRNLHENTSTRSVNKTNFVSGRPQWTLGDTFVSVDGGDQRLHAET